MQANIQKNNLINIEDLKQYITNIASEINEIQNSNEFIAGEISINDNIVGGTKTRVTASRITSSRVTGSKIKPNFKPKSKQIRSTIISSSNPIKFNKVNIFYFIGRLNPPHNGHIKALKTLVEMANSKNEAPLILLGSGPNRGERTMDNPITFELKQAFIKNVLDRELPGSTYVIQKMTNPAIDVPAFIERRLSGIGPINSISIKHIAGGKDEDASKLGFVLKASSNAAKRDGVRVTSNVEVIDAETSDDSVAMSATKVRKDAYKTLLDGSGFDGWAYKDFYGPEFALEMYNEIIQPAQGLDNDIIQEYIDTGRLPGKRGGKRRRSTNKRRRRTNKKRTARHKI